MAPAPAYTPGEVAALIGPIAGVDPADVLVWAVVVATRQGYTRLACGPQRTRGVALALLRLGEVAASEGDDLTSPVVN